MHFQSYKDRFNYIVDTNSYGIFEFHKLLSEIIDYAIVFSNNDDKIYASLCNIIDCKCYFMAYTDIKLKHIVDMSFEDGFQEYINIKEINDNVRELVECELNDGATTAENDHGIKIYEQCLLFMLYIHTRLYFKGYPYTHFDNNIQMKCKYSFYITIENFNYDLFNYVNNYEKLMQTYAIIHFMMYNNMDMNKWLAQHTNNEIINYVWTVVSKFKNIDVDMIKKWAYECDNIL